MLEKLDRKLGNWNKKLKEYNIENYTLIDQYGVVMILHFNTLILMVESMKHSYISSQILEQEYPWRFLTVVANMCYQN